MSRLAADLMRADACIDEQKRVIARQEARITELEGQLSEAMHRAITATEEARVATGLLRKQANAGAHVVEGLLVRSTCGPFVLTDAEAALFDTLTTTDTNPGEPNA